MSQNNEDKSGYSKYDLDERYWNVDTSTPNSQIKPSPLHSSQSFCGYEYVSSQSDFPTPSYPYPSDHGTQDSNNWANQAISSQHVYESTNSTYFDAKSSQLAESESEYELSQRSLPSTQQYFASQEDNKGK